MIDFAGHRFSEESVTANWPPTNRRLNDTFAALGRLISVCTPVLESVRTASDSVAGCPGSVYLLKQLHDGLRQGGTISGLLSSVECGRKLAFSFADRRIHLISIGEDCGTVDMALQMAARMPAVIDGVREAVWQSASVAIDEDHAFLLLTLALYFSAGLPPTTAFEKTLPYFSGEGRISVSIERVIEMLDRGLSVSKSIERSQLFQPEIENLLTTDETRNELETTLNRLANLSVWPV